MCQSNKTFQFTPTYTQYVQCTCYPLTFFIESKREVKLLLRLKISFITLLILLLTNYTNTKCIIRFFFFFYR